jgi:hypothetical protein
MNCLALPDILLPVGGTAYLSGYLITWWWKYLPFRISDYLVEEVRTLPWKGKQFLHQVIGYPEG